MGLRAFPRVLSAILSAGLAAGFPQAALAQLPSLSPDYEQFRADLRELGSLSPRLEGSSQERAALAYVRARLGEIGAAFREVSYAESQTVHSFSSGIEVTIGGSATGTLLVVVPMDHAVRAKPGEDGSAGVAAALGLVRELVGTTPAVSVRVLFLGAEHGSGAEYPIGSRRYLEGFTPDAAVAVLYLEIRRAPSSLAIRGGTNGIVSPQWLVETVTRSLERAGLPFRLRGNETQVYRLGVAPEPGAIAPYLRAGYPTLGLEDSTDGAAGEPTDSDAREWLVTYGRFLSGLTNELGKGIPLEWDRHYLFFQVGGRGFTVPEGLYIPLLCALVAACLLYAVLSGHRGRRYARALLHGLWSLPLHLLLLFAYALVPSLVIELLLSALDFPTLWQIAPLQLLLLKLLIGVSLFSFVTPLLTRPPLPRTDSFYASAAILLLVASLVTISAYEVSLAYYLAWALVFLLASVVARDRTAKILLYLVGPAPLVRAAIELVWLREYQFIRLIILDRLWGNLLVVAAVAPIYFMALRLRLLLPGRRRPRWRIIIVCAGVLCMVAASVTAVWIGRMRPYRGGEERPISAGAVFDYETATAELRLECPMSIREYTVVTPEGEERSTTSSRSATLPLELPPQPLLIDSTSTGFLDRRNVHLVLSSAQGSALWPYRLSLRLVGDAEFVLFDASFPFLRDPSGREYTIRVGANPPSPLSVELTLPRDIGFGLLVTAEYLELPPGIEVLSSGAVVEPRMEIDCSYSFGT